MLEGRRAEVLRALVDEHIRTGEPVSSRSILRVTGLDVSGATIRNDLQALERDGYVVQPHTSAGRVPTGAGYRYYVDHLAPSESRAATEARIAEFFSSVHLELGRLLKATSQVLSEVTDYPSVVLGPSPTGESVKAIHMVQLGARTALLVLVTESGHVCQEACELASAVTPAELAEAEQALASSLVGHPLGVGGVPDEKVASLPEPARQACVEALAAVNRAARSRADVYIGGTRRMATVWEDLQAIHRVLELLEREATMLNILARTPGLLIQIGRELPGGEDADMAVVSTSFHTGPASGRVGVIGPMRMDYKRAISAVESVGRELDDHIGP